MSEEKITSKINEEASEKEKEEKEERITIEENKVPTPLSIHMGDLPRLHQLIIDAVSNKNEKQLRNIGRLKEAIREIASDQHEVKLPDIYYDAQDNLFRYDDGTPVQGYVLLDGKWHPIPGRDSVIRPEDQRQYINRVILPAAMEMIIFQMTNLYAEPKNLYPLPLDTQAALVELGAEATKRMPDASEDQKKKILGLFENEARRIAEERKKYIHK